MDKGRADGAHDDAPSTNPAVKRNAFSELMSPKSKLPKPASQSASRANTSDIRAALLPYIAHPESCSKGSVITTNPTAVLIHDRYPKATIHLLLLPRDLTKSQLDPRVALSTDPAFLASVRAEAAAAVALAAKELARRLGSHSAVDRAREAAIEADVPPSEWPPGRDWSTDVRVGVHAHPSMTHLHIHVISVDMHSERMKHRKHYNSFNTDFFIPLEAFPLAADDVRWQTRYQNANLSADFRCWRCGKGFGNKFAELKRHLEGEFEEWRAE